MSPYTKFKCQGCDKVYDYDDCSVAEHLTERLYIGDPYTDAQCPDPKCGALCYPEPEEKPKTYRVAQVWGEDTCCITQHTFNTLAEANAYWQGVEDADGWLDRNCVEDAVNDDIAIANLARNQGQTVKETKKELQAIVKWLKEGDNYKE